MTPPGHAPQPVSPFVVIPEGNPRSDRSSTNASRSHTVRRTPSRNLRALCVSAFAVALAFVSSIPRTGNLLFAAAPPQLQGVSGQHVLQLTAQLLQVAPKRFNGSPGHAAAEHFIKDHFAPEAAHGDFIDDTFVTNTPAGPQTMHNLLVKFPGKRDGVIVLATHYETNYDLRDINFVGANDGACTSALLIALGEYLRTHPPTGYSVYLLFDDGEESVSGKWDNPSDQLYGTRHAAAKWAADGTLPKIKAFLLADMIGWKQMKLDHEGASTPWLLDDLTKAAKETGHANYLSTNTTALIDDHIPFKERGVPVLDVVDYEYGTKEDPEAFHHHEGDTLDKLSAQSLQASADIFLALIRLVNQHS